MMQITNKSTCLKTFECQWCLVQVSGFFSHFCWTHQKNPQRRQSRPESPGPGISDAAKTSNLKSKWRFNHTMSPQQPGKMKVLAT